jgi:hypothetical protein
VMVTIVLLNVLLMCAWPAETFFFSRRRGFFTPAVFGGIAGSSSYRRFERGVISRDGWAVLLGGLLLAGDGLLRALTGARVGAGALAVDGKTATVTDALIATDLDLATDVG